MQNLENCIPLGRNFRQTVFDSNKGFHRQSQSKIIHRIFLSRISASYSFKLYSYKKVYTTPKVVIGRQTNRHL